MMVGQMVKILVMVKMVRVGRKKVMVRTEMVGQIVKILVMMWLALEDVVRVILFAWVGLGTSVMHSLKWN